MTTTMAVPEEILERILLNCDGVTLLNARQVFPETVDYLSEKSNIWEWCCKEEIPKNEIVEYSKVYREYSDRYKWLKMYVNWCWWESNIPRIFCGIKMCPVEIPKISCIAVSRKNYAVGSEDGRLRIFTENHELLSCKRLSAVSLTKIYILEYEGYNNGLNTCLVVAWHKGFFVYCFTDEYIGPVIEIRDVRAISVFGDHICYERAGGRLSIAKISTSPRGCTFKEIWFTRIYCHPITCFTMWNGTCTFLINGYIQTINYLAEDLTPMEELKKRMYLNFNFPLMVDNSITQILRDDIVISLYKHNDEVKHDFIEVIIMEEAGSNHSRKLFNTWEIFRCFITCIFLYGNTLVMGVDTGSAQSQYFGSRNMINKNNNRSESPLFSPVESLPGYEQVYFYHVSSWKNLDLRKYDKKVIVGKHPITNIAVKETDMERKFYVSSRFSIHEITGYVPDTCLYPSIEFSKRKLYKDNITD